MPRPREAGNLTSMASRTSGKGSSSARAGRSGGGKGPAKKTAARKPPARKPAPSPTAGQLAYRVLRGVWMGIARPVAALLRGIGQSAK